MSWYSTFIPRYSCFPMGGLIKNHDSIIKYLVQVSGWSKSSSWLSSRPENDHSSNGGAIYASSPSWSLWEVLHSPVCEFRFDTMTMTMTLWLHHRSPWEKAKRRFRTHGYDFIALTSSSQKNRQHRKLQNQKIKKKKRCKKGLQCLQDFQHVKQNVMNTWSIYHFTSHFQICVPTLYVISRGYYFIHPFTSNLLFTFLSYFTYF